MDKYIQGGNTHLYVMGTPSAKVRRLKRLIDERSVRAFIIRTQDTLDDEHVIYTMAGTAVGAFTCGVLAVATLSIGASQTGYVLLAFAIFCVLILLAGMAYYAYQLLGWLVVRFFNPEVWHWTDKLRKRPEVVYVGYYGSVRPAVAALGGDYWFERHADRYGDLIDAYLQDPTVCNIEMYMQGANDAALHADAEAELVRLAKGNVHDLIAEREGAKAEAKRGKEEVQRQLAAAVHSVHNETLRHCLQYEARATVTTGDVDLRHDNV